MGSFRQIRTPDREVCVAGSERGWRLDALVEGCCEDQRVEFVKRYVDLGGWGNAVVYSGALNADGTEIEGR